MSRRLLVVAALLVGSCASFATQALAQDWLPIQEAHVSFIPPESRPPVIQQILAKVGAAPVSPSTFEAGRNKKLLPLYASAVIVQALDVRSTLQVLRHGGGEGNPML